METQNQISKTSYIILVIILVAIAGVALLATKLQSPGEKTPTSADNAPPGSIHNLPLPEVVAKVRSLVAQNLSISEGLVIIASAFEKEWNDSCLGLGGPAESCLQVITPGYEVTVTANGDEYVYRTNQDGSVIREES